MKNGVSDYMKICWETLMIARFSDIILFLLYYIKSLLTWQTTLGCAFTKTGLFIWKCVYRDQQKDSGHRLYEKPIDLIRGDIITAKTLLWVRLTESRSHCTALSSILIIEILFTPNLQVCTYNNFEEFALYLIRSLCNMDLSFWSQSIYCQFGFRREAIA